MAQLSVVVGPPCAGKSTYVQAARAIDDAAIDFDMLAVALGSSESHAASGLIREAAFAARSAAIRAALAADDGAAWIIHTTPSARQVDAYVEAGASFIMLDPGLDECLARAESDGRPDGTEAKIRAWYDSPPSLPADAVTITARNQGDSMARPTTLRPPGADWCRIEAKAADGAGSSVDVYIYDEISDWGTSARDFAAQLAALDVDTINLFVNSPGGNAWDGVAIMNALRRHPARVQVTVDGVAASAASLICMAGDHITMNASAQLMIHDASGLAWGNAQTMHETAALLDKLSDSYADAYAKRAGGTRAQWRDAMRAETWYSAEEAVVAGLADEWDGSAATQAAAFDLSRFTFAGRSAAPAPALPVAALQDPPVSPEPGHSHHEKEDPVSDNLKAGLRERLGITAADTSEEAILADLDEALTERAEVPAPPTAALPEGVVAVEASILDELRAAGDELRQIRAQRDDERRAGLVSAAISDGRIPKAREAHWLAALKADEEGMAPVLAALAPNTVPLVEIGHSDDVESAEDLYAKFYPTKEA